ncbi:hypothetical protein [Polaribacter marinivivus]|uniref:DUF3592 domain-containing protein n=1 Tax=Polaribacter marinivivus TaxID=1524260 RepID=A0ABV8RBC7_9FLAO
MESIIIYVVTFLGFYYIFKAIKELDKIYSIKKDGIKANATVNQILETKHTDSDGDISYSYNYIVKFKNKRGKEIEKEVDYPITKKHKQNPPFTVGIIYKENERENYNILLENNKGRNYSFYIYLFLGFGMLTYVIFNNNGEFNKVIEYLENTLK